MKIITTLSLGLLLVSANAQQTMTPEMLIQMNKVSANGITKDGKSIIYSVKKYTITEGKSNTKKYIIPITGGAPKEIENTNDLLLNDRISPDGQCSISSNEVKVKNVDVD